MPRITRWERIVSETILISNHPVTTMNHELSSVALGGTAARVNGIRYHGVLAPGAALRSLIVPESEGKAPELHPGCPASKRLLAMDSGNTEGKRRSRPRNYAWAELLKRVFGLDVLACPRCGARMRILAAINPPAAIRKILVGLGLPSRAPPTAPAILDTDAAY